MKKTNPSVVCVSLLLALTAATVEAQTSSREVSVAAGAMGFDASGTGTAPTAAIRTSIPVGARWLLADFSIAYASLNEQFFPTNTRIGIAEGQLQFQLPAARVRPYLGLGGGWLHYFNNAGGGRPSTPPTISGSVGLRFSVSRRALARGEFRLRGWREGSGASTSQNSGGESTVGLGYTF